MTLRHALLFAALCAGTAPAAAPALELPSGARLAATHTEPLGALRLPTGPWRDGTVETVTAEGAVEMQAWQVAPTSLSTLQLLGQMRAQLADAGYETVFDCEARDCGGFEFRYAMDLLPAPAMHVDLGNFRYLLAHRPGEEDYLALVVSRSGNRGFVHLAHVSSAADGALFETPEDPAMIRPQPRDASGVPTQAGPVLSSAPEMTGALAADLERAGHVVLSDLSFETGSSRLSNAEFASLAALADWMTAHPEARIVLVGHTDAQGSLAANIELSRKRAAAVRDRLHDRYGLPNDRMTAEGAGYLAPLATNATEAGRTANRRVEVVLAGNG